MANDKKNLNVLVPADDDPTEELEALDVGESHSKDESEISATTTGLAKPDAVDGGAEDEQTELMTANRDQSATIDKLHFDLEVLQAKWQGLTTEIEARDEQAQRLNAELKTVKQTLVESKLRIAERETQITQLQNSLENRDVAYRDLADEMTCLQQDNEAADSTHAQGNNRMLDVLAGQLASRDLEARELHARVARIEEYADELRYQLRLKNAVADEHCNRLESAEQRLRTASEQVSALQADLHDALQSNKVLEQRIKNLNDTHAEEIRMIRFELGDAQATLTERETVAEQLASDLLQTRGVREELELRLAELEENNRHKLASLEKENKRLRLESETMKDQLHTKTDAINALLSELANPTQQAKAKSNVDSGVSGPDDHVSEHVDDNAYLERDRVTRLLIGHIDDQELQFPLFKDRLTIGRTRRNDIQLKSEHVSRRHAVVVIEGNVTRVIDWGSKNGVFVNARRIKEHFLQNGDVVGVGKAEFRYEERPMRDT